MHCSSMCDSGSLLKPLEIGNLWIFLYFLVPKKPSLVALGNPLSLIHATWTGFIKFLKTRRWEEKIEDTVKVVIGVLLVGQEGERGWQSYKCRELPALNPFRDLCNNPRVCESPMKGVNHTSQCLSREATLGENTLQGSDVEYMLQPWSLGREEGEERWVDIHLQRAISIKKVRKK